VNGNYYQICQTLQYDPDAFDEELKKLARDVEGDPRMVARPPKVLAAVQQVASEKGNRPVFALILFISLASAIALPLLIANAAVQHHLPAGLAVGICWVVLLACGLIVAWPRQFDRSIIRHSCSECHSDLDAVPSARYCPHCGVRFQERPP